MSTVPNLAKFRTFVNDIPHSRDQQLIKTLYLTAGRASEIAMNVSPSEKVQGLNAYGSEIKWKLSEYVKEKVLLLKIRTVHRREKEVKKKAKIVKTRILPYRIIALPLNPQYEPWAVDLAKYIVQKKGLWFPITRQRIWQIVRRRLQFLEPNVHPHSLRHWRLTHLVEHYGFDAYDLTVYAGWTYKTTFGHSGQLDTYLHLDWRKYFPKLLRKTG